jgi:hypothetical protein
MKWQLIHRLNSKFSTRCFKLQWAQGYLHTHSHENTHTNTHTHTHTHAHIRATQNWESEDTDQRKKKRQRRHWKEQFTGFLEICSLGLNSVEMGRVSTLLTADPRVPPVCFQCLLDGWGDCAQIEWAQDFHKVTHAENGEGSLWALCMYEAFSVDVGHARRCTQKDYLILIHATWYNVIKHLTWEISSILIRERTSGNKK